MKIRKFERKDMEAINAINEEFYPLDRCPDFNRLYDPMVITGEDGSIISAGGVELIAEGVLVTNKNYSEFKRGRALEIQLATMSTTCLRIGQDDLHAFVSDDLDETWIRALKLYGFELAGTALFKRIR